MVAARHQDPQELATLDRDSKQIVLTIDGLGLKVVLWISDKQVAFVKCVAEMFPDVPHRFCAIHFFRDLAKPVLALDSAAK